MKKTPILILLILLSFYGMAQKNKFSATLSYPLTTGDNFVNENYQGTIAIGAQYRFYNVEFFNLGASIDATFLEFDNENFTVQPDINARFIQPRLFGEVHLGRFRGVLGAGWAFTSFRTENALEPGQTETVTDNSNGFNLNVSASVDIVMGLFAIAQYDYIKISAFGSLADNDFNTNIGLIKLGLGYRF